MIVRCTLCIALGLTVSAESNFAQTARPRRTGTQAGSASLRRQAAPTDRAGSTALKQRPTTRPTVQDVTPELQRLLEQWEQASSRIDRLQGHHMRRVYDMVFKSEKWAVGQFYHERPDKGRIDIEPAAIKPGMVSSRVDPATKKPFELLPDLAEKWICDGKRVMDINEKQKEAAIYSIPPRGQGENIMNGPLPFLFGMPADTAKKRYQLYLVSDKVNPKTRRRELQIKALPRWQQDRANWREARIILDHPTFLPLHVKLIDTAGTKETVFSFSRLEVNKFRIPLFSKDPFRPNLRGYKLMNNVPGTPEKPSITLAADEQVVPDIATYPIDVAKERLEQAGFVVAKKYTRGGPAPNAKLVHKVRTCVPRPLSPLKKGSTVKLVVYESQQVRAAAKR